MNNINIYDNFIINDIAKKNYYSYGKFDEKLVIEDMKRIFVFTHDSYLFYVKIIVNSEIIKCISSPLDFIKTLKNITKDHILINLENHLSINMIYSKWDQEYYP
jgi:hypothetical protein